MCLNNLAEQSRERGDLKSARPLYEDALAEARAGGDPGNIALCLQNLAILLLQDGNPEGAGVFNLEALRIVRDLGLRALGVGVIEVAGGLALASGDLTHGIRLGAASLSLFQAMGITRDPMNARMQAHYMASVRSVLSTTAFEQARIDGANLSYEAALEEAEAWLEQRCAPP